MPTTRTATRMRRMEDQAWNNSYLFDIVLLRLLLLLLLLLRTLLWLWLGGFCCCCGCWRCWCCCVKVSFLAWLYQRRIKYGCWVSLDLYLLQWQWRSLSAVCCFLWKMKSESKCARNIPIMLWSVVHIEDTALDFFRLIQPCQSRMSRISINTQRQWKMRNF